MATDLKRTEISIRTRSLWNNPTLESQLPICFANGNVLETLGGTCPSCGGDSHQNDMHGRITRPIETVAVIEGAGICRRCNKMMRFHARVRDDFTVEWNDENGKWFRNDRYGTRPLDTEPPETFSLMKVCKALALWWWLFFTMMFPLVIGILRYTQR